ncbi:hypothetical protein D3C81_2306690 [compost metagenome]
MEVRRIQIVWSSDKPWSRYSVGCLPPRSADSMPIWFLATWGRITYMDAETPRESEKK